MKNFDELSLMTDAEIKEASNFNICEEVVIDATRWSWTVTGK